MKETLEDFSQWCEKRMASLLANYLCRASPAASSLQNAMYYAVFNGGKRIRPLWVYATGQFLNIPLEALDVPACAIELVHAFALIHDDLPAMDNADLRRGKPSCHKKFGEAIAILAGDALQTLAFEILATHPAPLSTAQRLTMVRILSQQTGKEGMTGGQALDMMAPRSLELLLEMYRLKTGALSLACIELALAAAPQVPLEVSKGLIEFIKNIGLAFQIQDDLLDEEGGPETIGKPTGIDLINKKTTYSTVVGKNRARSEVAFLFSKGISAIEHLDKQADWLRDIAKKLLQRSK